MSTYEARLKRVNDAIALKEPDRVPIAPILQCYPIYFGGCTMAEVMYDYDKAAECYLKYHDYYKPDTSLNPLGDQIGNGPMLELMRPKTVHWAGEKGGKVHDDSIHQFHEFPILLDEDMDFEFHDYSGWLMKKGLPGISELMEPMADWNIPSVYLNYDIGMLCDRMSTPESKEMMQKIWKIAELRAERDAKNAAYEKKVEEMGYPLLRKGFSIVPFDTYSSYHRGTMDSMVDMFDNPEVVMQFCESQLEHTLESIRMQGKFMPGKWVFIPLNKGMDGFMTPEQYDKFYWKHLQRMIEEIVRVGMVPYVYTEGPYDSRVECLKDVEPGKVLYHFEKADMARVKQILGDTACITGGFPIYLLHYGTKQQVIDECKRLIDTCAPGGGYIFGTTAGFDHAKPENVEAMFDTVKEYGKA